LFLKRTFSASRGNFSASSGWERSRDLDGALVAAHEAKWRAKETLDRVMWSAAEICGSTSLFQKHPLERFYRDMHLHMMHGRHDIAAQIVGAAELGEPYDVNRTH
jgi:alkylation response protein AidB-like acyl-CoA dehydrogenase